MPQARKRSAARCVKISVATRGRSGREKPWVPALTLNPGAAQNPSKAETVMLLWLETLRGWKRRGAQAPSSGTLYLACSTGSAGNDFSSSSHRRLRQYCLQTRPDGDNLVSPRRFYMLDGLAGVKHSAGTIVFVCSKCRTLSDHAYGAPNKISWYTCWSARSAVEHLESGFRQNNARRNCESLRRESSCSPKSLFPV